MLKKTFQKTPPTPKKQVPIPQTHPPHSSARHSIQFDYFFPRTRGYISSSFKSICLLFPQDTWVYQPVIQFNLFPFFLRSRGYISPSFKSICLLFFPGHLGISARHSIQIVYFFPQDTWVYQLVIQINLFTFPQVTWVYQPVIQFKLLTFFPRTRGYISPSFNSICLLFPPGHVGISAHHSNQFVYFFPRTCGYISHFFLVYEELLHRKGIDII